LRYRNRIVYGEGASYKSLLSPSYLEITTEEKNEMQNDLPLIWEFYRQWNQLYQLSLSGKEPAWIKNLVEYSLNEEQLLVHRLISREKREPITCRIDYISIGNDRKIAEMQWKSGGPGLFFAIQDIYAKTIPCSQGVNLLGSLTKGFLDAILEKTNNQKPVVVNLIDDVWLNGENYLLSLYADLGIQYYPFLKNLEQEILVIKRKFVYLKNEKGNLERVHFIYGHGLTKTFPKDSLYYLAKLFCNGNIWIESPPNYIYRQKWGFVLPFAHEFKGMFDSEIRRILPASTLITVDKVDLSGIIEFIQHPMREALLKVRTLEDIIELPNSIRSCLIFKCGAGIGNFSSKSKGVFRGTGSRNYVKGILESIYSRVKTLNEPWIIQPYINQTQKIKVFPPFDIRIIEEINAHGRVMIFATNDFDKHKIIGGLGNFGRYWKVSGADAAKDNKANIKGTCFTDIRWNTTTNPTHID
jgi:hypothetical protein